MRTLLTLTLLLTASSLHAQETINVPVELEATITLPAPPEPPPIPEPYNDTELRNRIKSLEDRVTALESDPDPPEPPPVDPDPPVDPTDPFDPEALAVPYPDPPIEGRIKSANFKLVGGVRLRQEYARGGLAIDFERKKIYSGGHKQRNNIKVYDLPEIHKSSDLWDWPILDSTETIEKFWVGGGSDYAGGLELRDGNLWVSPRRYYDTNPTFLTISGKDLGTGLSQDVPLESISKPGFGGGFIKGHPTRWLGGCGGNESGQGGKSGPTLFDVGTSEILMDKANHGTMTWEERERRPPNYFVDEDSWVALDPRDEDGDGQLDGRWGSDKVYAGGLWRNDGLCYWVTLGVGKLNYGFQSPAFAKECQTWLYTYDPQTFDSVEYTRWHHDFPVAGVEIGPDGRIWVLTMECYHPGGKWKGFNVSAAIHVYAIQEN